ncbi:MAG TPA: pyruvate kinase alpha/beta domain-containing protein, partial [Candidatus Absconditabacterales bacterium]|nr:pyruvate kinase alpha/beta domain-containing protein [Candidatus Absconditabacterales bacterium]
VQSALLLAQHINAVGIVVFTKSGTQAKLLSAYKAPIPILACTRDAGVTEKLGYYYGVIGRTIEGKPDITFDWISSQCQIIDNPNRRPFVVVADTDTSTGHYPAIQVIE